MSLDTDEAEHSIEMHLPYVAKVMAPKKDRYTVVPVLVGAISAEKEARYGQIFAKYLADPTNLFVISSDFCHWGDRFHYTFYDESKGEIHQSIKALDFAVSKFSTESHENCLHFSQAMQSVLLSIWRVSSPKKILKMHKHFTRTFFNLTRIFS